MTDRRTDEMDAQTTLEWPTNSLDLNPLENIWKLLKDVVQHGQTCPRSLEELMMTLERE
jgi:hypothetical protein